MLLKRAGVVPGYDLTSEAALAKLSYLLALPDRSIEDVTGKMAISLRGELTEQTSMIFEHPSGFLPQHLSSLSALGYAIARGSLEELQDVLKGDLEWLLNEADYSGNTPLVSFSADVAISMLTVRRSTWQQQDPVSTFCGLYSSKEHRFTCVTRPGALHCSLQRMLASWNMSRCFESLVLIFMLTSWTRQRCTLNIIQ